MRRPLLIKDIVQVDLFHFKITWNDEQVSRVRLSDLQKVCPCKKCSDEHKPGKEVADQVMAEWIKNVGRYAIQIEFTSGCSAGLYPFTLIRKLSGLKETTC